MGLIYLLETEYIYKHSAVLGSNVRVRNEREIAEAIRLWQQAEDWTTEQMAFAAIYDYYWARLFRFILRLVRTRKADAEDILQEAFLRLAQSEKRREIQNLEAWLRRTSLNIVRDRYRSDQARAAALDEEIFGTLRIQYAHGEPDTRIMLGEVLSLLSVRDQQLLLLVGEGFSHKEVGIIVKRPATAVKQRISVVRRVVVKFIRSGRKPRG